ncbi:MAG: hypothetical protein ABI647_24255 [Gemmatimonadota bacterium]
MKALSFFSLAAARALLLVPVITLVADPGVLTAQQGTGVLTRYDLAGKPTREVALAAELGEISGLAFSADGRLFAHGDETGMVWQLDPATGAIIKRFALADTGSVRADAADELQKTSRKQRKRRRQERRDKIVRADFEDIQVVNGRVWLLASDGVLYESAEGPDGAHVPYVRHDLKLEDKCEFEGLTTDEAQRALLLLCKVPHTDAWLGKVTVVAFDLASGRLEPKPRLVVPYKRLAGPTGVSKFHGSAFALAPGGQSYVLIAGPQRTFAEVALDGRVLSGGALDRASHRQPEGIAFASNGTILISDEAAGKQATIAWYAPRR